jgi:endonuclease YncB( thermonuclease family)
MGIRQKRRLYKLIFSLVLGIALLIISSKTNWLDQTTQTAQQNQPGLYSVNEFVDGDTIRVNMNGAIETVRFIGMDTPETHKPNTPVQCYGPQAAAYTKQIIGNNAVRLESDPLNTNRDRYGRLLRYVYLPDGTLVETKLINEGYAFAYTLFPFSKKAEFSASQETAKQTGKGLWSACQIHQESNGAFQTNPAS